MKRFFGFALIVALFSIPAIAAKNSQTMSFAAAVKVGSTQIPAGSYKVSWTGTAPSVQVTIAQNGKTLVTVPAKLTPAKNGHVGMSTNTVGGVDILQSIQLDKFSLVFSGASTAG
jgi:hypothetical protein